MAGRGLSEFQVPVDKYEKVKVIGKGSFGSAVLVKSLIDGNHYVSKEINLQAMNEKDCAAAQNEVDVLTRVKHPNIIQYIEHYDHEGVLYIVMEYADGGDLLRRIQKQKKDPEGRRFTEDQVMFWFIQMALAVKHMHDNKILHRDLKSANIFLTQDNLVKIGDFGFGKIMANTIAQAKTLCGTPYYFSPELCLGKPYNNKSDVWALGCILAEMCILGHAYDAKNIKELMKRVIKGTYQPIPSIYGAELHRLIENMLVKDQVARPNIKSILAMEYPQAKLRLFAQTNSHFEVPMTTESNPEAKADVKEMEEWAARQKERADRVASTPQATKPRISKPRSSEPVRDLGPPVVRGPEERPPSGDPLLQPSEKGHAPVKLNRAAMQDFLKGPPPAEVTKNLQLKKEATAGQLAGLGANANTPVSGHTPVSGRRANTPKRDQPDGAAPPGPSLDGELGDVLDQFLPQARRKSSGPKPMPVNGAGPSPGPSSGRRGSAGDAFSVESSPKAQPQGDVFDAGGHTNWNSIVAPDAKALQKTDGDQQDKDEFGSFAVQTLRVDQSTHQNIMTHVNAALQLRPGTAQRERRAAERAARGLTPEEGARPLSDRGTRSRLGLEGSPRREETPDFSDNAVTMGSTNLRSLLVIELGDELLNKIYGIALSNEDDEGAVKKIEAVIGPEQTKEIAPLVFKLVMLENETLNE